MKKYIKKLIKLYEKHNPSCKVKYKPEYFACFEIYNSGGLISILDISEFQDKIII